MWAKQVTSRLASGLVLAIALTLAGQPLLQPLHVLLHHHAGEHQHEVPASACDHEHGHHHHYDDAVHAEPAVDHDATSSIRNDGHGDHAPCHVCELLSLTNRTTALLSAQVAVVTIPCSEGAYHVTTHPSANAPLAAVGRAPPVIG